LGLKINNNDDDDDDDDDGDAADGGGEHDYRVLNIAFLYAASSTFCSFILD